MADFPVPKARIVYLALADARGHVMRAHLVRGLCRARGVEVDIVTTSREGQAFLAALGTPSVVLSEHFAVAFTGCHDMAPAKTDACILRYYVDPSRALRDFRALQALARGACFVVSDSLHPLLLAAPLFSRMRVVHVFGDNIWRAAAENFEGRAPAWFQRLYRASLARMRDAAFACILHTVDPSARGGAEESAIVLPPILPMPARTPAQVRADLGVGPRERLAAVYLNPHFRDPRVAASIEAALAGAGYRMHAVGEGYASRSGWRARDPDLASVVRAADVLVSGAGMGALAYARVFGTPLIALLGRQPEQRKNAQMLAKSRAAFAAVDLGAPNVDARLAAAIEHVARPRLLSLSPSVDAVHDAWARAFLDLVDRARHVDLEHPTASQGAHRESHQIDFARPRNEQPPRRRKIARRTAA